VRQYCTKLYSLTTLTNQVMINICAGRTDYGSAYPFAIETAVPGRLLIATGQGFSQQTLFLVSDTYGCIVTTYLPAYLPTWLPTYLIMLAALRHWYTVGTTSWCAQLVSWLRRGAHYHNDIHTLCTGGCGLDHSENATCQLSAGAPPSHGAPIPLL
jgi:hypothetical protein